jgi:hypothetical protein
MSNPKDNPTFQYVSTYIFDLEVRLNVLLQENQEYGAFGPQHVAPGPVPAQGGFPHLLLHQVAAPGQSGAESIRRLASRYLHQPNSRVDSVCMEPDAAGRSKMVIILDVTDVL